MAVADEEQLPDKRVSSSIFSKQSLTAVMGSYVQYVVKPM
jgi:hypothetical protein